MTLTYRNSRLPLAAAWILIVAVLQSTTLKAQVQAVPATAVSAITSPVIETAIEAAPSAVQLIAGRSTVLNLASPIARVSLTSADIADALVTSPTQLLVHGKIPGTISMLVWERAGAVHRYEIVVARDVAKLAEQVHQAFSQRVDQRQQQRQGRRAVGHGVDQGSGRPGHQPERRVRRQEGRSRQPAAGAGPSEQPGAAARAVRRGEPRGVD
jgi:hypothetical protein